MKKCPVCNQTYTDETLNFCLSDGGTLTKVTDDPPPTVFMNQARQTNQNWTKNEPFTPPSYQPISPWQNQQINQNPVYMSSNPYQTPNQTLPTVSLVLGIIGVVFCCWGFPFGIAALITGYLGYNNSNTNPTMYGGRGLAIAGMILGAISIFEVLFFIIIGALGK
jgi:hypothetical protein